MALSVPKAPGVSQMMKDGARVSLILLILYKIPMEIVSNHVKTGFVILRYLQTFSRDGNF